MRGLRGRLVVSHLLVALVGAAVTAVVVALSAPTLFDRGLGRMGPGFGAGGGARLRELFVDAMTQGLLLGAAAALLVALVAALVLGARLLRPIDDVRTATRRIAEGDYASSVREPRDPDLAALARDVNALGHALGEVESRRVRLLGEVAHEMRTPLTVLTGRVEGLQDGVFEADEELLSELQTELARLTRLAADLSALSQVEEGRLPLEPVELDLDALVDRAAARWRALLAEGEVVVSVRHAARPVRVRGDEQRLGQVLDNLLGNAVRAVGGRGVVEVTTGREGDEAVVRVRDDGVGIPPGDLERIFERFYRGSAGGSGEVVRGSGIGLTVSRGIARAHGGALVARSAGTGTGATFVLSLPVAR